MITSTVLVIVALNGADGLPEGIMTPPPPPGYNEKYPPEIIVDITTVVSLMTVTIVPFGTNGGAIVCGPDVEVIAFSPPVELIVKVPSEAAPENSPEIIMVGIANVLLLDGVAAWDITAAGIEEEPAVGYMTPMPPVELVVYVLPYSTSDKPPDMIEEVVSFTDTVITLEKLSTGVMILEPPVVIVCEDAVITEGETAPDPP